MLLNYFFILLTSKKVVNYHVKCKEKHSLTERNVFLVCVNCKGFYLTLDIMDDYFANDTGIFCVNFSFYRCINTVDRMNYE